MTIQSSIFRWRISLLGYALAAGIQSWPARAESFSPSLNSTAWEFQDGKVEFVDHEGIRAMHLLPGSGPVILKSVGFTNGIIEFDLQPDRPDFVSLFFRRENADENEVVYLRTWNAGKPMAPDTLQYAPTIKGVTLWDLLGHYQAPCDLRSNVWNHVKLVVAGKQLRVFVNDMSSPVLAVPRMEGDTSTGGLAVQGSAYFANLKLWPDETDGVATDEGIDPTANDPRYLRYWRVTPPVDLPPGREPTDADLPQSNLPWKSIEAERRGLINITRQFGKHEGRKLVWLKTAIHSTGEQIRQLQLGFSDEVWLYVNGGLTYLDKNIYLKPIRKPPQGRCALENSTVSLPLKEGNNEILIGVANDFYGWGIVARLDTLEGLELHDQ